MFLKALLTRLWMLLTFHQTAHFATHGNIHECITINIDKTKTIAHDKRREARSVEFQPYDDAIAKQIPGQMTGAEEARAAIRAKYATMQTAIDAASTVDEVKAAMPQGETP
jgi:hypothetical protein